MCVVLCPLQENQKLREQNEELNGQILSLSLHEAKNLFATQTKAQSLAAEIDNASRDQVSLHILGWVKRIKNNDSVRVCSGSLCSSFYHLLVPMKCLELLQIQTSNTFSQGVWNLLFCTGALRVLLLMSNGSSGVTWCTKRLCVNHLVFPQLMEALKEQEEINVRLRQYMDKIILSILDHNPSILEIKY